MSSEPCRARGAGHRGLKNGGRVARAREEERQEMQAMGRGMWEQEDGLRDGLDRGGRSLVKRTRD